MGKPIDASKELNLLRFFSNIGVISRTGLADRRTSGIRWTWTVDHLGFVDSSRDFCSELERQHVSLWHQTVARQIFQRLDVIAGHFYCKCEVVHMAACQNRCHSGFFMFLYNWTLRVTQGRSTGNNRRLTLHGLLLDREIANVGLLKSVFEFVTVWIDVYAGLLESWYYRIINITESNQFLKHSRIQFSSVCL